MSVGIVAQLDNPRAAALAEEVHAALASVGIEARIDESTATSLGIEGIPVEHMNATDLVVSIGGDGTFLFAARSISETPIIGVNLGEVGFLTTIAPASAAEVIPAVYKELASGEHTVQRLPRLTARFDERTLGPALNEVIVHAPQRGRPGGIVGEVRVDGETYLRDHMDGVMVATPTGSTAYNLSEDGPLLVPAIDGLVVNVMCGRDAMPPLVVPLEAEISIGLSSAAHGYVIADGRERREVDVPVKISIGSADDPVRVAGPRVEFFEGLGKLA